MQPLHVNGEALFRKGHSQRMGSWRPCSVRYEDYYTWEPSNIAQQGATVLLLAGHLTSNASDLPLNFNGDR